MAEWIPYMWSKRALAEDIVHYIRHRNPKAKYFYDIFWGGGSVSFEALQQGFEKVYMLSGGYKTYSQCVAELNK